MEGSQEIKMKINRIILDMSKSYKENEGMPGQSVVGGNLDWFVMGQSPCFWPGQQMSNSSLIFIEYLLQCARHCLSNFLGLSYLIITNLSSRPF